MRRFTMLLAILAAACGGHRGAQLPVPATMEDALNRFLDAVHQRDIPRMGRLFGSARGPAAEWMADSVLQMRMSVVQRYLDATSYKVLEGPLPVPGRKDRRIFRVELQSAQCVHVQPIELIQASRGGWLVYDVHLENANEAAKCRARSPGTGP
jgi:hypothetical protein